MIGLAVVSNFERQTVKESRRESSPALNIKTSRPQLLEERVNVLAIVEFNDVSARKVLARREKRRIPFKVNSRSSRRREKARAKQSEVDELHSQADFESRQSAGRKLDACGKTSQVENKTLIAVISSIVNSPQHSCR